MLALSPSPHMLAMIAILLPSVLSGQSPPICFEHLSIPQGLSQGTVFTILQDRQGFIWFGTADGLNKYDGYSFVHYHHDVDDSTSISDNRIIALLEDSKGRLWIGTIGGGLNLFDRERGTFRRYRGDEADSLSLSDDRVNSLYEDRYGILWIGTTTAGVNAFDPRTGVFKHYRHDPSDSTSLSSDHVFPIAEDAQGNLWIGTPKGLNLYERETGRFKRVSHSPDDSSSLSHDYINSLYLDKSGSFWVGTVEGLNRLIGLQQTNAVALRGTSPVKFDHIVHDPENPESLGANSVWAIFEDQSGSFWVGTDGGGLNRLDRQTLTVERFLHDPSDPSSLSDNSVRSIFQDLSGTLWIGTNVGGVNTWNPRRRRFVTYSVQQDSTRSISANWIHTLWEDRAGRLWVGTAAPVLDVMDLTTGLARHIHTGTSVEAFLEDTRSGGMWVGTRTGLFRAGPTSFHLDPITFSSPDPDTLSARRVRVLASDRAGNIWIGMFQRGVIRFRPEDGTITRFTHDPKDPGSLSNDFVRAIHQDHAGGIWIGTYGGLDRYDPLTNRFVHHTYDPSNPRSLSNENVISLFDFAADSGRILWVGTFGGGLCRLDTRTGEATRYTTRDGIPNNVIYGILGDGKRRLWITTNRGMAQLDPFTGNIRTFDVSDGLQGNEFSTGASHTGRSGIMFVGGVGGLSLFHPDSIDESMFTPPIVITAIRTLDHSLSPGVLSVEIGPGEKYLTFEFATLDYANPPKNQYAYRLQGFDDRWTAVGTQRLAAFTNLDPGEYLFEVRGTNSDGVWNPSPATVRIVVVPPLWRTWWFLTISATTLLVLGYGAYRRRLRAHIEKARIINELQAARSVQMGLLPTADPVVDGLEVSGICLPAHEVGGDFFEYLQVHQGNSRLTLALGDVAGKGMNAAMTAAMAIGMLHREGEHTSTPAAILRHINASLYVKTERQMFVALLLASFDTSSRTLTLANAGQSMPLRRRRGVLTPLKGKGERFPLGLRKHPAYADCTNVVQPGDILFFTTDGVTDARTADGTFFEDAGFENLLLGLPQELSAREMVQAIVRAIQEFGGDHHLQDDVTVVVAKIL